MKGAAPNRSRVTSHSEVVTNATIPVCTTAGKPMRISSATITAATPRTANPRMVSPIAQARSGRFTRRGLASSSRGGALTISLAGSKHGLPLDRDGLERRGDLGHQRRTQRRVVQSGGELLAVVLGPPEEVHQRLALARVGLVLVDEQPGEARDGIRGGARRVGDRDAVVLRNLRLRRRLRNRFERGLDEVPVVVLQLRRAELVLVGVGKLNVADRAHRLLDEARDSLV